MAQITAAGSQFLIGTTVADPSTDNFISIGEITGIGEFGTTYQEIKHNPLQSRQTIKLKGSFDSGNLQVQLALDPADAGQIAAQAALASDSNYNFRVVLNNAVTTGGTGHGTRYDFKAKVMGFTIGVKGVNDLVSATINVSISGVVTTTAAA